jgi:O-antigen/teichoic acid export membrane protein
MSTGYLLIQIRQLFSSQLRRNFLFSIASNGFSSIVAAISYPVYLSFLGFEHYGIWLALSSVLMLAQLGNLGIAPAITKYVAEELSLGNKNAAESYIATALVVISFSAVFVGCSVAFGRNYFVSFLNLSSTSREIALELAVPIAALSAYSLFAQVSAGVLVAVGRTDQFSLVQTLGKSLGFVLTWLLLLWGRGISSLLWGSFLTQLFTHLGCELLVWRSASLRFWRINEISREHFDRILRFGLGVFSSTLVQMPGQPLNRMFLSRYGGVSTLPHFETAYAASMQLRSLLGSSAHSLMPEFSKATTTGDAQRIRTLNVQSTKFVIMTAIPVYVPLMVFAPEVLRFWLRHRFSPEQVPCFRIMLFGSITILFGATAYYYLLAVGKVRSVFVSQFIQTFGTLLLIGTVIVTTNRLSPKALSLCVSLGYMSTSLWLILSARRHYSRFKKGALIPASRIPTVNS